MDTKFQTSFIPKKPITADSAMHARPSSSSGLFGLFAILVLIISVAGAALSFFWNNHLLQVQTSYQNTLKSNESEFNPTLISTLQSFSQKISFAKGLLANHLAPDAIFNIIGQLTAQDISFSSLTYAAPSQSNNLATISMSGVGQSFSAIAFQSDVFGSSAQYGENITLEDPVLSDLNVGQNGQVAFSFTASLDPSDILYSKILAASLGDTAGSPATGTSTQ